MPAGQSGDWSQSANWGGTPTSNDTAYIVNGGTANVTTSGDACSILSLGSTAGSGAVEMTGGGLSFSSYLYDGYSGTGNFTQSGGTNSSVNGYLDLGYNHSGSGTYTLNGGQLSAFMQNVGYSGTGNFIQTGGTNSGIFLYLGRSSGGNGTYNLSSSGLLSMSDEVVGSSGTGNFTQSGGTNSVSGNFYLGNGANGNGTYNLFGGILIVPAMTNGSGTAALNLGGGTLQASSSFSTTLPMNLIGSDGGGNVNTAGYTVTLSGSLSDSGHLSKFGSGTLILSGTNSYTEGTTVNGGNLQFTSTSSIPPLPPVVSDTVLIHINSGGAVNVTGAYTTIGVAGWLGSGNISTSSSGALALTGNSSENFSVGSYHTISLGAAPSVSATYSGTLTPYNNTYYLGGGGGTLTYSPSITSGSLVLNAGPGTVILTNTNTYNGGTTVNTGTLEAAVPSALPGYSTSGKLSVASGATIAVGTGARTSGCRATLTVCWVITGRSPRDPPWASTRPP